MSRTSSSRNGMSREVGSVVAWNARASNVAMMATMPDETRGESAFMFEDRDRRLDLSALALLAVTIFWACRCSATVRPIRSETRCFRLIGIYQPDTIVYPAPETVSNLCGQSGAVSRRHDVAGLRFGRVLCCLFCGTSGRLPTLWPGNLRTGRSHHRLVSDADWFDDHDLNRVSDCLVRTGNWTGWLFGAPLATRS